MLRVYFLNVGHGDSTLIEHPSGRLTMIDINNSQDYDSDSFQEVLAERREKERARRFAATLTGLGGDPHTGFAGLGNPFATVLVQPALPTDNILLEVLEAIETTRKEITDPVKFLQKYYPGRRLWRFILSHPDLDHMRGIKRLHQTIGFDNFWDTANTKPTPTFKGESDKEDWFYYQQLRAGGTGFKHNFTRGDRFYAFNANADGTLGGDGIEILSPTSAIVSAANWDGKFNNLSLVLRIWHAGKSILLPGDIEESTWEELQRTYGPLLNSTYLKASHHGRDTGYHLPTLQLINPAATAVSVGRKPATDASSKYRNQCDTVLSTRFYGNLELQIDDDGTARWYGERNA